MPHLIANLECATESLRLGGRPLLIWRPLDGERLVLETTQEEFGEDERLPYWAVLWPASIALAEFLVECVDLEGKEVLELGAGLAVPGLAAARAGATVVVSDWFGEPLEFAHSSARLNGLDITTRQLDWREPPEGESYDLIIGADLLYERRGHGPILDCVGRLLRPGGTFILSDPQRHTALGFWELAEAQGWRLQRIPTQVTLDGADFVVDCVVMTR
jgi:predicted nicotinamide N-methyase